jgi:hypothetical protein
MVFQRAGADKAPEMIFGISAFLRGGAKAEDNLLVLEFERGEVPNDLLYHARLRVRAPFLKHRQLRAKRGHV